MNSLKQLQLFMEPKSIAVVGVSRRTGKDSWNIFQNLLDYGFDGKIYPVNPAADEILGTKAYPAINAIPDEVDLCVIATPRNTVLDIVRQCTEKGIKAINIIAQGFADSDEEGKKLQQEILEIAGQGGARIIGPNTFGTMNAFLNFSTAFPQMKIQESPIGLICQSGIFFVGLPRFRYGKAIDLGNAGDVDMADCLSYFEDDPEIKVINIHMEGLRQGDKFLKKAKQVVKKKPVIVLKTARSAHGAKAAQSHTGALSGNNEIFEKALKQNGIIQVDDMEELEDVSYGFTRLPRMKGENLAIAAWAYSTGVMAADACQRYSLEITELASSTLKRLRSISFPDWLPINNPLDLGGSVISNGLIIEKFKKNISTIIESLMADENSHAVLIIVPDFLDAFPFSEFWDISDGIKELADTYKQKPLIFSVVGRKGELNSRLEDIPNIATYPSPERSIRVLSRLWQYRRFLSRL